MRTETLNLLTAFLFTVLVVLMMGHYLTTGG